MRKNKRTIKTHIFTCLTFGEIISIAKSATIFPWKGLRWA